MGLQSLIPALAGSGEAGMRIKRMSSAASGTGQDCPHLLLMIHLITIPWNQFKPNLLCNHKYLCFVKTWVCEKNSPKNDWVMSVSGVLAGLLKSSYL